jgi:hypothetical protein
MATMASDADRRILSMQETDKKQFASYSPLLSGTEV